MDTVFLLIGAGLGWLWGRLGALQSGPAALRSDPAGEPGTTATPAAQPTAAQVQADAAATETGPAVAGEAADPPAAEAGAAAQAEAKSRLKSSIAAAEPAYEAADNGAELAGQPAFLALVDVLAAAPHTAARRLQWITSQTTVLGCAALAAMTRQGDGAALEVARCSGQMGYMALYFALRHVAARADAEAVGELLLRAKPWWSEHPATRSELLALLTSLEQQGLEPVLAANADADWSLDERRKALAALAHPLVEGFLRRLQAEDRARRGRSELARVGRSPQLEEGSIVAHSPATDAAVETLLSYLEREARPSGVLLGPEGAGKTTLARRALARLMEQGWAVVEATPAQLMAGQKFIGEIEQRIENFVSGLSGTRALCFVPQCHALLETGSWSGNPRGLLDLLLPHLERRSIQLLGESTASAWTRVQTQRPQVETLLPPIRVEALDDADMLLLVQDFAARSAQRLGTEVLPAGLAAEAMTLARQHFPERAEPGRTLGLLKDALAAAVRADPPRLPLDREQLLASLARSSGLPLEIIDLGRKLDVAALRADFGSAVIGQDEAVDCLVDRISMLKAGLTDPGRPIGVFLFAGPTGTGKTELVKTLARYLFGSADRMLRLDMSEYQSEDAYWRLLDDGANARSRSLITRIREQPFAVVLLDEFEKAHPRVWDLFLQVFDDGRLSDRSGNSADFRHCIIVLTSNLGATISKSAGVGFTAQGGVFDRSLVDRAISRSFRPEFINRIDRVVVFNPLTRALMRDILSKELRSLLKRRGFRHRDWAVEWEASAIEFLLDKGFTPDLGARPLRRAIDQHLLAPLARTMVEHKVPDGEQFLFVYSDGDALRVRFVDPDAATEPVARPAEAVTGDLRTLALDARADAAALALLQQEIEATAQSLQDPVWLTLKATAAQAMQASDFWQKAERSEVLDCLERADRIEAGLRSAQSLLARLQRGAGRSGSDLVRRLALLVLSLQVAIDALKLQQPEDARLEVRPADARSSACLAWRDRLLAMYRQWAGARGLRISEEMLDPATGGVRLLVSGYGALQGLQPETGMHVLEPADEPGQERVSVRVSVNADGSMPSDSAAAEGQARICRRYREGPQPLVRDLIRGWRSGRLDRVLAGDFDLLASSPQPDS